MYVVIVLLILLLICEKGEKYKFISPRFAYIVSFIPPLLLLCVYQKKWDVELKNETVVCICGGALVFIFTSCMVKIFVKKIKRNNIILIINEYKNNYSNNCFTIPVYKLRIFLLFQIVTCFLLLSFIKKTVNGASLRNLLYNFRQASVDSYIDIPSLISIMRLICLTSTYFWIYLITYENRFIKANKKKKALTLCNLGVSVSISLLLGARGGIVSYLVFGVLLFFVFRIDKSKINFSLMLRIILILTVGVILFQNFGRALGRELNYSNLDYIAIYLSAPIKNLDLVFEENKFGLITGISDKGLATNQTFRMIINYIAISYNKMELYQNPYIAFPYRHVNGYMLGNCYTAYYYFLYDGGWLALVVGVMFMATVSQLLYQHVEKDLSCKSCEVKLSVIIYFIIYYCLVFSFFAAMFYVNIFSISFIRELIILMLLKIFFYRSFSNIKFKNHKIIFQKYLNY